MNLNKVTIMCKLLEPPMEINCDKHGKQLMKYITDIQCPICHQLEIEQHKQKKSEKLFTNKYTLLLSQANIPIRYRDSDFKTYIPNSEEQKKALMICQRYVSNLDKSINIGKGLLFLGESGLGKTHLAISIIKELTKSHLITSLYLKHYELINNYNTYKNYLNHISKIKLLVIDEAGIGDTSFNKDITYQIIDKRYDEMKPTIIITNLEKEKFNDKCSLALKSRLAETTYKVIFKGEDYRLQNNLTKK